MKLNEEIQREINFSLLSGALNLLHFLHHTHCRISCSLWQLIHLSNPSAPLLPKVPSRFGKPWLAIPDSSIHLRMRTIISIVHHSSSMEYPLETGTVALKCLIASFSTASVLFGGCSSAKAMSYIASAVSSTLGMWRAAILAAKVILLMLSLRCFSVGNSTSPVES